MRSTVCTLVSLEQYCIVLHFLLFCLSVQAQQLILMAQDPDRLCAMFPGWGAWL